MDGQNNLLEYSFFSSGIPKEYFNTKYSSIIDGLDSAQRETVKQFLEKKIKRIWFITDNYEVPYVVFRRMLTINLFFHGESRAVDAFNIQNKETFYANEKLYGIFHIDPLVLLNKSFLFNSLIKSCDNGAHVLCVSNTDELVSFFGSYSGIIDTFAMVRL